MGVPGDADEHRRVVRLEGDTVVRAIRAAGGPDLTVRARLQGGEVGARLVERDDGREWVLTVAPPLLPASLRLGWSVRHFLPEVVDQLGHAGLPAPLRVRGVMQNRQPMLP